MKHLKSLKIALLCLSGASLGSGLRAEAILHPNDLIAICGDSITEQRRYSVYMAAYFLMCQPEAGLRSMQLGRGGENAGQFTERLHTEVLPFQPDIVTTCYGMNDGAQRALTPERAERFRTNTQHFIDDLKHAGVRDIVLGSPGVVDPHTYSRSAGHEVYNNALAGLGEVAREVAAKNGLTFVDIHSLMMEVMTKAEAKYGPKYYVAGEDGIHPSENGHMIMAYAFLKAMGCEGDIGTITYDAKTDQTTATEGHTVLSTSNGTIEVKSTRYPFCFTGDPADPSATSGIIEFFPFNQDLNRYMLVVKNATASKLKVTWGKTSKVYSAKELSEGINLADEFLDNPFGPTFRKISAAISQQQSYESRNIRQHLRMQDDWESEFPEAIKAKPEVFAWQKELIVERGLANAQATTELLVPIQHQIRITAVE